jgi:folylpolyglutamate synthase
VDPNDKELATQHQLADAWNELVPNFPKSNVHILPTIEHAVKVVESINTKGGGNVNVLVAGSLHLVGGTIEVAGLSEVAL